MELQLNSVSMNFTGPSLFVRYNRDIVITEFDCIKIKFLGYLVVHPCDLLFVYK